MSSYALDNGAPTLNKDEVVETTENGVPEEVDTSLWISRCRDAYKTSKEYFESNIQKQIDKNLSAFRSQHHADSKYSSADYRYRSKLYRPKTRSAIRKNCVAANISFFSTQDLANVAARDTTVPMNRLAAAICKELLNYRLTESIPWHLTVIGAYTDAQINGICISKQTWEFEERDTGEVEYVEATDEYGVPIVDSVTGEPRYEGIKVIETIKDEPVVELIPVENFYFDPAADWRDPVKSSPYLIQRIPMYIHDIKQKMRQPLDQNGWFEYDTGTIQASQRDDTDESTRQRREGDRGDSHDQDHQYSDWNIAWVHENIMRIDGQDMHFFTLGTEQLLTLPTPVEEVYPATGRPYVVGICEIEPHRPYSTGLPDRS